MSSEFEIALVHNRNKANLCEEWEIIPFLADSHQKERADTV